MGKIKQRGKNPHRILKTTRKPSVQATLSLKIINKRFLANMRIDVEIIHALTFPNFPESGEAEVSATYFEETSFLLRANGNIAAIWPYKGTENIGAVFHSKQIERERINITG